MRYFVLAAALLAQLSFAGGSSPQSLKDRLSRETAAYEERMSRLQTELAEAERKQAERQLQSERKDFLNTFKPEEIKKTQSDLVLLQKRTAELESRVSQTRATVGKFLKPADDKEIEALSAAITGGNDENRKKAITEAINTANDWMENIDLHTRLTELKGEAEVQQAKIDVLNLQIDQSVAGAYTRQRIQDFSRSQEFCQAVKASTAGECGQRPNWGKASERFLKEVPGPNVPHNETDKPEAQPTSRPVSGTGQGPHEPEPMK
jgi:hypothetical protein